MKVVKALIIGLILTSCLTQKQRDKVCASCPVSIKDSIREVIKITSFDTALYLSRRGKDLMFDLSGDCCSTMDSLFAQMSRNNGTITATSNGIKSSIFKKDKKIVFRCEADSLKEVIKGLRTVIDRSRVRIETKIVTDACVKQHKDWLDKYDRPWFFISLGALLVAIGWKFRSPLLKLIGKGS